MPANTPVHKMAKALQREGHSVRSSIRIAQSKTGKSYQTGRAPKSKKRGGK